MTSPLEHALANAEKAGRLVRWAYLWPIPLIILGVALMQIFAPGTAAKGNQPEILPWYKDIFLLCILVVYVVGQLVVIRQLHTIGRGLGKAKAVVRTLLQSGTRIPLADLLARLAALRAPGHLADLVASWIQMGMKGEVEGIRVLTENASYKRARSTDKKLGVHVNINRVLLKLGFVGTLIGLMMTFPPMKEAILTLDPKNVEKGISYIEHIAFAIDADAYAILTTLMATAFSLFVEVLTILLLKSICGRFEEINAYVEEWSLTELQPWIRLQIKDDPESALMRQKAFQAILLDIEREFQGKIMELHRNSQVHVAGVHQQTQETWSRVHQEGENRFLQARMESEVRIKEMQEESVRRLGAALQADSRQTAEIQGALNKNVEALGRMVRGLSDKMSEFIPMQQHFTRRMDELLAYERQYRSFLEAQSQVGIPRHLKPETVFQAEVG